MLNLRKLEEEQTRLSKKVVLKNEFEELTLIGGLDHSYFDQNVIAGIVVCKYPSLEIVERKFFVRPSKMPYIPGFLAYRAMPAAAEAYSQLDQKPHLMMIDGNGILHPRGCGIASHF
ncbi:MAG TPA: endonuclease V, partial [Candidatus Nanoarchaeia archaeon]|nr:endonuclease V [Candidatus Nanoarchaeia archaeon]